MVDGSTVEPIAARYEELRQGAMSAALGAEAATGLALLLGRGVWAWARLVARPERPRREPFSASGGPPLPSAERSDLARLLAGMALAHAVPPTQGSPA